MRLGIDLGGTKIEAAVIDDHGAFAWRQRVATPRGDYRAIVETVARLVATAETAFDTPLSVGVGTPGAISPATGLLKNANTTVLNGQPLREDLERAIGRPLRLANDANCFALSEAIDGAAAGASIVFGVIIGTGTGGGVVIDRRVLTGHHAIAGEWGHNPLPWPTDEERPGPPCYCGKRGCIETFLSGPGLARDHGGTDDARSIAEAAERGDGWALASLDRYVDRLARALATVINVIDPDVIVLGGGLSNIAALYREVPPKLGHYVFSDRVEVAVRPPVHGDSSGVRGAAWLW